MLGLSLELNFNDWLARLLDDLERKMLHIGLNLCISEFPTDQTLGIENGVDWVHSNLVLCRITDQTLSVGESNERWSRSVALVVGNDLDAVISKDSDAGICGT